MVARIFVPLCVAGLVLASMVLTVACGSDDETTTTMVASTTPSTTATSDSTTTTGGSTTTGGPTTTEALSSAETLLPNGNIKAMGFIDEVWEEGGTRYLSIDYAEMLTGQEAVDAAIEAGAISPGEDLPNDYFIRNVNPQLREFKVAADASFVTVTLEGGTDEESVSWEVFTSFWTEFASEGATHLSEMPWWIERDGDTVVSITEQYLP